MNTNENLQISTALKVYRVNMGMKAKVAAAYLGMNGGNYSRLENGYGEVSPQQLSKIKALFDVWRKLQIDKLKAEIIRLEEII